MSIPAVAGVRTTSAASIAAQVAQLRRQERQLTRELAGLVAEGGAEEGAEIKQRALEAQILVIRMRIAQLEARRSEALQAALGEALPAVSRNGLAATSTVSPASSGQAPGRLDIVL